MFAKTTSHVSTFVTLSNRLLKWMKKQRSRRRSIMSMLNKTFDQHFTVFKIFVEAGTNLIKLFFISLNENYRDPCLFVVKSVSIAFFLSACSFVYAVVVLLLLCVSTFFATYFHLFTFLWPVILFFNFTKI